MGAPGGPSCQIIVDPLALDPCSSEGTAEYYPVKISVSNAGVTATISSPLLPDGLVETANG